VRLGTVPRPESLLSYEFSYEHKLAAHWQLGTNVFYEDYSAIGWIPALYYSSSIGKYRMAGGELEASYTTGRTRIMLSHGITRLVDAAIPASLPPGGQAITAQPYGYGNNLAEWAPYITKFALVQNIGKRWTASSSLVHYSGFPGARDFAAYAATLPTLPSAMPSSDPGYDTPYGPNLYVNSGVEFRPADHWAVRLDGYNLAALADKTLSKRNYYFRLSEFSVQSASAALSLRFHWGSR
jgi:iron complex outermembrane receptor protein